MNTKTIYQVDAFTDEPFKGNPAGVMMVDENTNSGWMQHMAAEMNLSETAFLIPDGNDFRVRYFTPESEVPLCGHATLASAHILYETGMRSENQSIRLKALGGDLLITKAGDWIVMNFPRYTLTKIDVPVDFKATIGFEPPEVYSSNYHWIVAIAPTDDAVREAKPTFGSMNAKGLGHLMITAKCSTDEADFVVRCFAPGLGVDEDPVTGSAHCALTPLWAEKLGKTSLDSWQLSKRSGRLKVKLMDERVEISGKAVTVFVAELKI